MGIQTTILIESNLPWLAGMKPYHTFILARWSLEVDYRCLCLLGLNVLEKMQCQKNTDNQTMLIEGNKCFPPSLL